MKLPKYKIKTIGPREEEAFIKRWHYSKKVVPNSAIRFGCYHGTELVGVATFGRIINCVQLFKSISNRSGLELNRLAMVDSAPKNSESWFLSRCILLLRKHYPWLKFINTWADGARCQGGTIYKACGFYYIRKHKVRDLFELPGGHVIHTIAFNKVYLKRYHHKLKDIKTTLEKVRAVFGPGVKAITAGYQYNFLKFLDLSLKDDMIFKPLPYEKRVMLEAKAGE